ncbi:acetolactate decarboxylase [Paraburkholderia hospita]|uniref:acetolactate decarboxylase n=1 Tax=Paraburkholderia hospita TaxID=169430 RepID=UPI0009A84C0B
MQDDGPAVAAEASSSASPWGSTDRSRKQQQREQTHTLFQVSTSGALVAGLYQGVVSTRTVLLHGDFGFGAFADLDRKMVIVDGHVLQARGEGNRTRSHRRCRGPVCRRDLCPQHVSSNLSHTILVQAASILGLSISSAVTAVHLR